MDKINSLGSSVVAVLDIIQPTIRRYFKPRPSRTEICSDTSESFAKLQILYNFAFRKIFVKLSSHSDEPLPFFTSKRLSGILIFIPSHVTNLLPVNMINRVRCSTRCFPLAFHNLSLLLLPLPQLLPLMLLATNSKWVRSVLTLNIFAIFNWI